MKRALTLSVVDQSVLSAQSLSIGLLLIAYDSGDGVGRYALAMAIYFAFLTVQDALAGSVLANRVMGRAQAEQSQVIGLVSTLATVYLMPFAALFTLAIVLWLDFSWSLSAATVCAVQAGLFRELTRAVSVVISDMKRCLVIDGLSAVMSLVLLPVFWILCTPEVACLWAVAVAHGAAAIAFRPKMYIQLKMPPRMIAEYQDLFKLTRWNLLTSGSREAQSRTFLFMVEAFRGLTATAALHVGRLITSPVVLFTMAIGRIVLPHMANHVCNGEPDKAYAIVRHATLFLVAFALLYVGAIFLSWPLLDHYLFKGTYPDITEIVLAWCVYSVLSAPLWCLTWLYRALERFRELAIGSFINAICVLVAMTCLLLPVPLYTAVIILTIGDVSFGAILLWQLSSRRQLAESPG